MVIWLTGSNGLLGQHVLRNLAKEKSASITCLATSLGTQRGITDVPSMTYESLDISDQAALESFVKRTRPTALINAAALTSVDACERDPAASRLLNETAVGYMADLCARYGIYMVHISTDFVFPGREEPYDEEAETHPISEYGRSKLAAERLLQKRLPTAAMLRTGSVYGWIASAKYPNIVVWIKEALMKGEELCMGADQWRCPTWANDLAKACLSAVKRQPKGIINVVGRNYLTPYEIACHIARVWGLDTAKVKPVPAEALNLGAPRPTLLNLPITRARALLNYQPASLLEALKQIKAQMDASAKA